MRVSSLPVRDVSPLLGPHSPEHCCKPNQGISADFMPGEVYKNFRNCNHIKPPANVHFHKYAPSRSSPEGSRFTRRYDEGGLQR